jgi:hypothetical protein
MSNQRPLRKLRWPPILLILFWSVIATACNVQNKEVNVATVDGVPILESELDREVLQTLADTKMPTGKFSDAARISLRRGLLERLILNHVWLQKAHALKIEKCSLEDIEKHQGTRSVPAASRQVLVADCRTRVLGKVVPSEKFGPGAIDESLKIRDGWRIHRSVTIGFDTLDGTPEPKSYKIAKDKVAAITEKSSATHKNGLQAFENATVTISPDTGTPDLSEVLRPMVTEAQGLFRITTRVPTERVTDDEKARLLKTERSRIDKIVASERKRTAVRIEAEAVVERFLVENSAPNKQ